MGSIGEGLFIEQELSDNIQREIDLLLREGVPVFKAITEGTQSAIDKWREKHPDKSRE